MEGNAVTLSLKRLRYQDRLSNYDEIEWYQFQQLSEVILIQENGPREAVEAVRKRLKHGTTQQKIRVLEVRPLCFRSRSWWPASKPFLA